MHQTKGTEVQNETILEWNEFLNRSPVVRKARLHAVDEGE